VVEGGDGERHHEYHFRLGADGEVLRGRSWRLLEAEVLREYHRGVVGKPKGAGEIIHRSEQ
jgi:hypothetical protein